MTWGGRGGNVGGSRGRGRGGYSGGGRGFDPLACYRCGVRGHLACDYPKLVMHKVLALLVLKMHSHSDLGEEAQGEVEDGKSGLEEWV